MMSFQEQLYVCEKHRGGRHDRLSIGVSQILLRTSDLLDARIGLKLGICRISK